MAQRLATRAVPRKAPGSIPPQDRTEEGEAMPSRRYDPERDYLMQLLLEQHRGGTDPLEALLQDEGAGRSSDFEAMASMSIGQVPRPTPRMRRGGDFSASTTIK